MTLLEVIRDIVSVAKDQPAIKMIVRNDIYRLNEAPETKYGVFAYTQGQHSSSADSDTNTFKFTMFYLDRLQVDRKNEEDIQSTGIEVLNNIIQTLEEQGYFYFDSSYTFQPFNQQFGKDLTAGVFVDVGIVAPKTGMCPDAFPDFNDDFNEDFLIL